MVRRITGWLIGLTLLLALPTWGATLLLHSNFEGTLDPFDEFSTYGRTSCASGAHLGGYGMCVDYLNGYSQGIFTSPGSSWDSISTGYVSYWFKTPLNWQFSPVNGQGHIWRLYGQDSNFDWIWGVHPGSGDEYHQFNIYRPGAEGPINLAGYLGYRRFTDAQWHHFELEYEMGDPGVANGSFRVWLDGTLWHTVSNAVLVSSTQQSSVINSQIAFPSNTGEGGVNAGPGYFDQFEMWDSCPTTTQYSGTPACSAAAPTFDFSIGTLTIPQNQMVVQGSNTSAQAFDVTSNGQGTPHAVTVSAAAVGGNPTGMTFTLTNLSSSQCTPTCSPQPTVQVNTTGSTPVAIYTIRLTATDGTLTRTRDYTVQVTGGSAPNPPTNLAAVAVSAPASDLRIDLAWEAPSSGPTPTSYQLHRCIVNNGVSGQSRSSCTPTLIRDVGDVLTVSDTELVPGTTYTYAMAAVASGTPSGHSNVINAATTQVGIAAGFPHDIDLDTHEDVFVVEKFLGSVATIASRFTVANQTGNMTASSADLPPNADASDQSIVMTNPAGGAFTYLYRQLANDGLEQLGSTFLRYYVKYRTNDITHHAAVWLGGYEPEYDYVWDRAGCKPDSNAASGNQLITIGFEPIEGEGGGNQTIQNNHWDNYNYWQDMHPDSDTSCNAGFGCAIVDPSNRCYWGNKLIGPNTRPAVIPDTWQLVEIMVKLNNPVTANNGELAVWLDGVKTVHLAEGVPLGGWTFSVFTPNPSAGETFEGFQWRTDEDLGINWFIVRNHGSSATQMKVSNVVLSTSYIGPIAAATDTEDPTTPGSPQATAVSSSRIDLTWTASSDNVEVRDYAIERCAGAACNSSFTEIATGLTATNYSNTTGLSPSTTYGYQIRAFDTSNNASTYSTIAYATTQAAGDTTPPTDPTSLVATTSSSSEIGLTWTASTDASGIGRYEVERCQGSGCGTTPPWAVIASPTTNSHNDAGLVASTLYRYRIRAFDASSNANPSGYSNIAEDTTDPPDDETAPGTPTGLSVEAISPQHLFATWTANTEPDLAGYRVRRGVTIICDTTALYCTEAGLTANTNYTYTVSAYDTTGNDSTESSGASQTTDTAPDITTVILASATTFINVDTSNYVTWATMPVYTWPDPAGAAPPQVANASLLQFPVSGIQSNATISSAVLYLLQVTPGAGMTYTVPVHPIINVSPVMTQATGDVYATGLSWTANACCFAGHPMAQADIGSAITSQALGLTATNSAAWRAWTITDLIQDWVDGTLVNRGLLLNADVTAAGDTGANTFREFASRNTPLPANRPFLVVTYTVPAVDLPPAQVQNLRVVHP